MSIWLLLVAFNSETCVTVQKSRRNSLLKRKKKSGATMKLKTLGIKVVDDTFKVSN